ncbi:MAG: site-specific integrase [Chrysiogenia bacterium]
MATPRRGKTYSVDYYFIGHRIRKGGFQKKTDAQKYLIKCKNDIMYHKHPMPRNKAISFNELANKYISEYSKLHKAEKSFKTDISLTKSLLGFFDGFLIRDITLEIVDMYKRERVNAPCLRGGIISRTTINREVGLLRNMLNTAVDWQMLESNPILRVKMFKEEPRERVLSEKELQSIVDYSESPHREILITAMNVGMRKGEIFKLKWDRVNLDESYIMLVKTKTKKIRQVPLNGVMKEMLSRLYLTRAGNPYVFPNPETGKPFVDIKRAWKTILKNCNIEDFRFHDLRHCFASYALAHGGGNLADLKDVLGHEKITTTARYVKSFMDGKQKLVDGFQIGAKAGTLQEIKKPNKKIG